MRTGYDEFVIEKGDLDVAIAGAVAVGILALIAFAGWHAGKASVLRAPAAALCEIQEDDGEVAALAFDFKANELHPAYVYLPATGEMHSPGDQVPCKWLKRYANT